MSTETGVERRFGPYGGRYVPETLIPALDELEREWLAARSDPGYQDELGALLRDYVGRPTPLYLARRLSEAVGSEVYLKREDLLHTGAHKINNAIGQALLAKRMGKPRVIAETGAGQHGVAAATACALLDLECVVYMGTEDMRRQRPERRADGAARRDEVAPVEAGARTLKEAVSAAIRDWVTNVDDHPLRDRLGGGPGAVPGDRARPPAGDRRRGARPGARGRRPAAGPRGRLRRRRLQRDRHVRGLRGRRRGAGRRGGRRGRGSRPGATRRR